MQHFLQLIQQCGGNAFAVDQTGEQPRQLGAVFPVEQVAGKVGFLRNGRGEHATVSLAPAHEAGFLKLDCSRLASAFGWRPVWGIGAAVEKTVEWAKAIRDGEDARARTIRQLHEFLEDAGKGGNEKERKTV